MRLAVFIGGMFVLPNSYFLRAAGREPFSENRAAHQTICMARFNADPSAASIRVKTPADFGS